MIWIPIRKYAEHLRAFQNLKRWIFKICGRLLKRHVLSKVLVIVLVCTYMHRHVHTCTDMYIHAQIQTEYTKMWNRLHLFDMLSIHFYSFYTNQNIFSWIFSLFTFQIVSPFLVTPSPENSLLHLPSSCLHKSVPPPTDPLLPPHPSIPLHWGI